jgi:hypothetical protein
LQDYIEAHEFSSNHRRQILQDNVCGCFYCLSIFSPKEIIEWVEDRIDGTAICPHCGIDSVIGESAGYPLTKEFLKQMSDYWF